jgi:cell division protease FtsH
MLVLFTLDCWMDSEARTRQIKGWYTVAAVAGVLVFQYFWTTYTEVETIPYSRFEELLAANKISELTVGTDSIEGALKEPLPNGKRAFYTIRVDLRLAVVRSRPVPRAMSRRSRR